MNKVAIYPGTFDPITYGHIDVIKKSLKLFNKIIVGVSDVSNTNKCMISLKCIDNTDGTVNLVIFSVIDNLVKGASGQAVQNMNIMFDLDEKTGLY